MKKLEVFLAKKGDGGLLQLVIHKNNRMDSLDAVRGVAIIAMVIYHGLYDVSDIFGYNLHLFAALMPLEPFFAAAFIVLAGISSRYSHNNLKRGLRVFFFAMVVTAVTVFFIPSQSIYFGILHFMGIAILLFIPLRPAVDRIPPVAAAVIFAVLFAVTYTLPESHIVGFPGLFGLEIPKALTVTPNLYPLGFPDSNFFSADYFPLIPWFFMFLIGTVVGVPIKAGKLPEKFYTARISFLPTAGRNTLIIYVVHQPVIYGLLTLGFYLFHMK